MSKQEADLMWQVIFEMLPQEQARKLREEVDEIRLGRNEYKLGDAPDGA